MLGASGRLGQAIAAALQAPLLSPAAQTDPAQSVDVIPVRLLAPARAEREAVLQSEAATEAPKEAGQPYTDDAHQQDQLIRCRRWLDLAGDAGPDVVVNCIAMSDVDRCEREQAAAMRINAGLPAALARAARERRAHLIHFSTDFVFDGTLRRPLLETDPAAPLSVYGKSKLAGERAITAENGSHWIFRISWLYGSRAHNLAATLLDPAQSGQLIRLANNRIGVPNPVQLIARETAYAIRLLQASDGCPEPSCERSGPPGGDSWNAPETPAKAAAAPAGRAARPPSGLYHLSSRGQTSWHEFGGEFVARALAAGRLAPGAVPRIIAVDEDAARRPARRPAWSVLDPTHYEQTFGRKLPSWQDAIALALCAGTGSDSR